MDSRTETESSCLDEMKQEFSSHLQLIRNNPRCLRNKLAMQDLEFKKAPLFSSDAALHLGRMPSSQYGLLGVEITDTLINTTTSDGADISANLIYANHSEPWSAFICGVQGSGKSHSLATLLENCLLSQYEYGKVSNPLTAMAFHFDPYSGPYSTQQCELAYFSTAGIKVRVLVSPENLNQMKNHYENLPGIPPEAAKPEVYAMKLTENQLDSASIKALMSFGGSTSTLHSLLSELKEQQQGRPGIDFEKLKKLLAQQGFNSDQKAMLDLRMHLLEAFIATGKDIQHANAVWDFEPGSLTIVDLSSESVDSAATCGLYAMILSQFMAKRFETGRVIVLDEAHKFLTATGEAHALTEHILMNVREQRHNATRVLIATQEPTLDTRLLDLCNVSIVHNFASRAWFNALKEHLAGSCGKEEEIDKIFRRIVELDTGNALVFSPRAMVHVEHKETNDEGRLPLVAKLGDSYIEVKVRPRVTFDGGQSITAQDKHETKRDQDQSPDPSDKNHAMTPSPSSSVGGGVMLTAGRQADEGTLKGEDNGDTRATQAATNQALSSHSDAEIEQALRNTVPKFWNAGKKKKVIAEGYMDFINMCITTAKDMGLDKKFFTKQEWKARSKAIVLDEMDRLEKSTSTT